MSHWTMLFFILAGGVSAPDPSILAKARLYEDLMSTYDSERRPVKDQNRALSISLQMTPTYFTIDEYSKEIHVRSIMTVKWQDESLMWKPEDYSGVKRLRFKDGIWLPDESLYMSDVESEYWNSHFPHPCDIQANGSVSCLPFVSHTAICVPREVLWPYEVLECSLRFGTWVFTEQEIKLTFDELPVDRSELKENRQWSLITATPLSLKKYKVYNDTYPALYLGFIISKRIATHAAIVVIPAIALAILTIASGLMASGGIGLGVAVTSLMAQIFYLIQMLSFLPLHGDYPSHIVKLFVDCLIITTVTILMYVSIIAMTKLTHKPPRFISMINTFAKVVPAKIFTFGEVDSNLSFEERKDEIGTESMENLEWRKFATVVNNTFFFTISIVYIVLLSIYV